MATKEEKRRQRVIEAEVRASRWLADGNEAAEAGKKPKAEYCYAKAQYWLDVANEARGLA